MGLFPRQSRKKFWLLFVLFIGLLVVGWRIWHVRSAANRDHGGFDKPVPVATATATRGDLKLFLGGLGTVTAANSVVVNSRVDGQLLRVHFKEGQFVKAGDLLAEIDPRPFEVQLTQAQGQLARDTALLKNAQIDLERYQLLWSQDSIAKQQVDAQESLVRQYEGATKVDEGQVANAKLQLTYAKVIAPISGRVGLRQVDPGNIVHTSDTGGIATITQLQPIHVIFTLPEDNLPRLVQKLNTQQTLVIDVYDRSQKLKLASGMLFALDNQIDTATGTIKLKAEFKNDNNALFPNQFVNARMQIDTLRDAILIPVGAVQRGAQGDFVYVVQPGNAECADCNKPAAGSERAGDFQHQVTSTVKLQSVRVGESDAERVAIVSGVEAGAAVVTEGLEKLRDGSPVDVVQRDGQALENKTRAAPDEKSKKHFGQKKKLNGAGER